MKKGNDWNSTDSYGVSEFNSLTKGGYICKIVGVKEETSKNGNPLMVLAFDIAEGEFKDYYMQKFNNAKKVNPNAKYSGTFRQLLFKQGGGTNPFFKGIITTIEKSNSFVLPDEFGEKELKGKLFGGLFGLREYEKTDGKSGKVIELMQFRSVDVIRSGEYKLPEDVLLPHKNTDNNNDAPWTVSSASDDDLPF